MAENPYAFVAADDPKPPLSDESVFDLESRRIELADVIRRYLNGTSSLENIAAKLLRFQYSEPSDSIRFFSRGVIYNCGRLPQHSSELAAAQWKALKRSVVLLESDFEILGTTNSDYSWRHIAAATAMLGCGVTAATVHGMQLLPYLSFFGIISLIIKRLTPKDSNISITDLERCFSESPSLQLEYDEHPLCQPNAPTPVVLPRGYRKRFSQIALRTAVFAFRLVIPIGFLFYQAIPVCEHRMTVASPDS